MRLANVKKNISNPLSSLQKVDDLECMIIINMHAHTNTVSLGVTKATSTQDRDEKSKKN